ncbi:hypothetical protein GCM10023149_26810 [Mucilaginibacter gynuensis]|uniref:DUF2975 domain-containing protein n=1 Tax=Mucilaginibacter gynuensis TaxID=1302236 RepID=A0ABP8GIX8_9SPHI
MKILGKNSLSAIIAVIINFVWWLEWVAAGIFLILFSISGHIRGGYVLKIPITFSEITTKQLHPFNTHFPVGILNATNAVLGLSVKANWQNIAMLLIGFGIIFATVVIITYQLKKIFLNFKQNLPFNHLNIIRIKNIAYALLGYSFLQWLFVVASYQILNITYNTGHVDFQYDFTISYAIMGIVLIIVAEIFRLGLELEEEKQLTI